MAIEVRIPTILRTYTDGAKQVEGTGSTLGELLADLDSKHGGLRDRLVDDGGLRRFVNVYLNDEDVRFLAGLDTPVKDGDTVTVLDRRVEAGQEADVLVVEVHVHKTPQAAAVVNQALAQATVPLLQVGEQLVERGSAPLDLLGTVGVRTQDRRDTNLDGH